MHSTKITLIVIMKNSEETLDWTLKSVKGLADDYVIVDNGSTDNSKDIASKYTKRIFINKSDSEEELRKFSLKHVNTDWVLVLDSDEVLTPELIAEIKKDISESKYVGYYIPQQKFIFNTPINHGGESYSLLRLFLRDKVRVTPGLIHAHYEIPDEKTHTLKHKLLHYSYRNISQLFTKFTKYAQYDARIKYSKGERSSLKKIILYPLHMFYSRYIKEKGYKDPPVRIILDIAFAYMELLTYLLLLFQKEI